MTPIHLEVNYKNTKKPSPLASLLSVIVPSSRVLRFGPCCLNDTGLQRPLFILMPTIASEFYLP